jgi:hypothetical protein
MQTNHSASRLLVLIFATLDLAGKTQSPFDYGQNKKIYFCSSEQREFLGIDQMIFVDQLPLGGRGGMGENWEVTSLSFSKDQVADQWAPIQKEEDFVYSLERITDSLQFLNGELYTFSNGELVSNGGTGYGTFDWKEVDRCPANRSVVTTTCTGHCGYRSTGLSENIFDTSGRLLYTLVYPEQDSIEIEDPCDFIRKLMAVDTLRYAYDSTGLLKAEIAGLFGTGDIFYAYRFHQCYIGDIKMEKYLQQKFGFTPELLLVEIYRYGVFSFVLNKTDRKYYRGRTVMLED